MLGICSCITSNEHTPDTEGVRRPGNCACLTKEHTSFVPARPQDLHAQEGPPEAPICGCNTDAHTSWSLQDLHHSCACSKCTPARRLCSRSAAPRALGCITDAHTSSTLFQAAACTPLVGPATAPPLHMRRVVRVQLLRCSCAVSSRGNIDLQPNLSQVSSVQHACRVGALCDVVHGDGAACSSCVSLWCSGACSRDALLGPATPQPAPRPHRQSCLQVLQDLCAAGSSQGGKPPAAGL